MLVNDIKKGYSDYYSGHIVLPYYLLTIRGKMKKIIIHYQNHSIFGPYTSNTKQTRRKIKQYENFYKNNFLIVDDSLKIINDIIKTTNRLKLKKKISVM